MTPLEYANYMVQYEGKEFDLLPLAELFFKHGYDPNRPTSTGLTFLHEVATYSQALVDLAVENGANMHLKSVAMGQTIEQMLENDIKECKDDDRKKILMYMSNYIQEKATQEAAVNSLSDSQSDRFSELDRLNDKTDQNVDAPTEKDQKKQSKSCTIM
ncbi:uncharacterized protein LOC106151900 [Lingula anatina]|uniref:Uncharacterized protein LOC106151900 n=1 Tax=Lingula anatina TaxID=7574 RepID=A0A1S3H462_LINAN|nr:uncharacterized protein LOC106151900 [Lingula anatina]|eukprot:XP_013380793.1 uncharacterized protein LOC106151900 [Lingula anatina]